MPEPPPPPGEDLLLPKHGIFFSAVLPVDFSLNEGSYFPPLRKALPIIFLTQIQLFLIIYFYSFLSLQTYSGRGNGRTQTG